MAELSLSRRRFLKGALAGTAGAAAAVAMPNVSRAQTVTLKMQSSWGAKSPFQDMAKQYIERATSMAGGLPERPRVHYNRGLLVAQMARDEDAEAALRTALPTFEVDSWKTLRPEMQQTMEIKKRKRQPRSPVGSGLATSSPKGCVFSPRPAWRTGAPERPGSISQKPSTSSATSG